MRQILRLTAALVVLAVALPVSAAPIVYIARLNGANESPPVASTGTGKVKLTVDTDASTIRVEARFKNLLGTTLAAHIHCCTLDPFAGNFGVATTVPTFLGFPGGVTHGSYDATLDGLAAGSWNPAYITANGGTTASAFAALTSGIAAGKAYFNVHTTAFPSGEIRDFFRPVPAPGALALLGIGLAGVGLMRRRPNC